MTPRHFLALGAWLVLLTLGEAGAQNVKSLHPHSGDEIASVQSAVVGFSAERLGRLDTAMKSLVETGQLSRALTYQALVDPKK